MIRIEIRPPLFWSHAYCYLGAGKRVSWIIILATDLYTTDLNTNKAFRLLCMRTVPKWSFVRRWEAPCIRPLELLSLHPASKVMSYLLLFGICCMFGISFFWGISIISLFWALISLLALVYFCFVFSFPKFFLLFFVAASCFFAFITAGLEKDWKQLKEWVTRSDMSVPQLSISWQHIIDLKRIQTFTPRA